MKRAIVVVNPGNAENSPSRSWGGAFADGLRKHGWNAEFRSDDGPCDLLVLWGVRRTDLILRQKANGGEVCILERGYIGDRFKWTSVSFGGGLNGRGVFRGPFEDASRWRANFADLMKPWRGIRGGYALILGQVPGDMSVHGTDLRSFYKRAAQGMRDWGFEVAFRPHPKAGVVRVDGVPTLAGSLEDAFFNSAVTVSFNSNSSTDAVLYGLPSITMDQGAMAWEVTGHKFEFPHVPVREPWAAALAWKQWTMEEILSGACWEAVRGDL
jgi:hypothetical protein